MSGEQPDLEVPPEALALIAQGIERAHGELKDLGMFGNGIAGRGFSELALSGMELGHEGLAAGFKAFCERWEWGVRGLMFRGNVFAAQVGLSAGAYHEQEQYLKDTFKVVVNGLNGNPHLSEDEVRERGWQEIKSQSPYDAPDGSAGSFARAHEEIGQTWRETRDDVLGPKWDAGAFSPEARKTVGGQEPDGRGD
ncbi:hypothetical protein [Streptomyces sp. PTD5-9]|uniref:hypothetical protein n=1 Tax=Streptomyces sp. PTD5-9 TaxID=3120150 RepID=UPI00300A3CDB